MSRATPMSPEDRRASLLAAARCVFSEGGYHRTSVSDIIKRAGVARGTFYNYFISKRSVFQAVLHSISDEVSQLVQPIDVDKPIPPQVRTNLVHIIEGVMQPEVSQLLFNEAAGIDADAGAELRSFYDQALDRIERALTTGQELGWVCNGNMRLTAQCLLGMVKEPVFQAGLRQETLDLDALVEQIFQIMLSGILR